MSKDKPQDAAPANAVAPTEDQPPPEHSSRETEGRGGRTPPIEQQQTTARAPKAPLARSTNGRLRLPVQPRRPHHKRDRHTLAGP